jgi:hypothetical protein
MTMLTHEIRHAARDLLARPAWSLLVIAVLAAGLGCARLVPTRMVLEPAP